MDLKPRRETVPGDGREFLRTPRGLRYKTAGGVLEGTAFPTGTINGGTAVYLNDAGHFVPWPADATALTDVQRDTAALTAHSVKNREGSNPICGFVVAGHPREDRCTGVTPDFKAAAKGRLVFEL